MKIHAIITNLEQLKSAIEWDYSIEFQIVLEQTIKRLEKDMPKDVLMIDKQGCYGKTEQAPYCPNCCENVLKFDRCIHCGQALKWEVKG
jgi:hypothetical protein